MIAPVLFIGLVLAAEAPARTAGPSATVLASSCVSCHKELGEDEPELAAPVQALGDDVHAGHGLGCHDCHGGEPAPAAAGSKGTAHDRAKGFVGAPTPADVPRFCARCHSDIDTMRTYNPSPRVDQLDEYRQSVHGKKNAAGDEQVATCSSCHGHHGVLAVANPRSPVHASNVARTCGGCHADTARMEPYGIPTSQMSDFEKSVHGKAIARGDLAAPTCNDCHGNHGAAPPGVKALVHVCGSCHAQEALLFAASPLKAPWERLGLKECIKCHGNHLVKAPSDAMVGPAQEAVCTQCHDLHGQRGKGVAEAVRASYDELKGEIARAEASLDKAEQLGMEVSQEKYELTTARDALVAARVLVHSFDAQRVRAKVEEGLKVARNGQTAGEQALEEMTHRRTGLLVALGLILLSIVLLWLKLREIEAVPETGTDGGTR